MGEGVYREVLKNPPIACRVYAPVGQHRDLLAYLVRRLLENGANSSFVHQLADESVGMDELLVSPLRLAPRAVAAAAAGPLRRAARRNSAGLDLDGASACARRCWRRYATHAGAGGAASSMPARLPARCATRRGQLSQAGAARRVAAARRHAAPRRRCACRQQMPRLCALLVEGGLQDLGRRGRRGARGGRLPALLRRRGRAHHAARGAARARPARSNELRLIARGPWVCISPWNFPLAIFTGQVAAALATGNTVLAKPAEQTPAIALEAVKLLHAAGVPADALQLLHGPGETVGAALVAAPGVAGVVFTGSTQVAKIIHRALAAKDGPIVPLIAETGGINAMLVDSHARCPSRWPTRWCRAPSARPASAARRCACCACTKASPTT